MFGLFIVETFHHTPEMYQKLGYHNCVNCEVKLKTTNKSNFLGTMEEARKFITKKKSKMKLQSNTPVTIHQYHKPVVGKPPPASGTASPGAPSLLTLLWLPLVPLLVLLASSLSFHCSGVGVLPQQVHFP